MKSKYLSSFIGECLLSADYEPDAQDQGLSDTLYGS